MNGIPQNGQGYFGHYKTGVEKKLNWGDSKDWRHHDFETLSEKIFAETGVMLSSTTLKRVWGRLKYDSIPNSNTLNALAAFVGHANWLEFKSAVDSKQANGARKNGNSQPVPLSRRPLFFKKKWVKWAAASLLFSAVAALALGFILKNEKGALPAAAVAKTQFSSDPVALGIPNTVVFKYDVSHLSAQKVEIQQSWDERLRFEVGKDSHEATSTYYYPGYYRAKLLADGQVLKEHDLYLKSNGWLSTLNRQPQPRYFLKEEMKKGGRLAVEDAIIMAAQPADEAPATLGFHYVDDFGDLHSDNFTLEASIKNTYSSGNGICQFMRVIVLCTEGVMIVPFSIPGCVGHLRLTFSEVKQEGRDYDLSALGCDFSEWQKIRFEVRDKKVDIFLNGSLVHSLAYQESAGKVAGMRFLFAGNGEVDDVRLMDGEGGVVFEDGF
ncbi:MAG TPA: hypothetical protein ENJ95_24530 [Bacteroidetes bacterium]|nr:hypothetical protein [Bacteroidota bacterium]